MNYLISTFLVVLCAVSTMASKGLDLRTKFGGFNRLSAGASANGKLALEDASTFPSDPTYGILELFTDDSCTQYIQAMSVLLDTCMTNGTVSRKYTCNDQQLNVYYYRNAGCNTLIGMEGYSAQCTPSDIGEGGQSIQMSICGTTTPFDFPGSTVVFGNYQSDTCNDEAVGGFGIKNLHCFENGDGSSFEFDWPYVNAYSSADCSGPRLGQDKLTNQPCENVGITDDAVFSNTYTGYSFKSSAFSNISFGMTALFSTLIVLFYSMKY